MKKIVLLICILLVGCSPAGEVLQNDEEEVLEIEVKEKKYPTLESYVEKIEFQDGKTLRGDPGDDFFYDTGKGIAKINIAKFYKENKETENLLEAKKIELSTSRLLSHVRKTDKKDPGYEFLKKNIGVPGDELLRAKKNKELLDSYKAKKLKNLSQEELMKFLILAEEDGDYLLAEKIQKYQCQQEPKSCETLQLKLSGWVKDDQLQPISGTKITVLNNLRLPAYEVEEGGAYEFMVAVRPYQLVRLRYQAIGHMPQIKEIRIGSSGPEYEDHFEVRMPKAHEEINSEIGENGTTVETQKETVYKINPNGLRTQEGEPYSGNVKTYTYDFNPWTDDLGDPLANSIRVEGGVAPRIPFVSFGMPYAEFVGANQESLRISKKNPATVITTASDIDAIYKFFQIDISETSEDFWKYWMDFSEKTGGFTTDTLERPFANYWVYNLETGIWDEVPMKVLGPGRIESLFYTHN